MSNNASPAPSERRRVWRYGAEALLFVLLLAGLSLWLSRHMLPSGHTAPTERLPRLDMTDGQLSGHADIRWPAATDKTLLYFFAPWCAVCKVSMPSLNLLPDAGLRVVVVALDWQNAEEVYGFVRSSGFNGEVLLGDDGLSARWQIDAYPSYYVIDQQGQILHRDRGISTPPGLLLRTL